MIMVDSNPANTKRQWNTLSTTVATSDSIHSNTQPKNMTLQLNIPLPLKIILISYFTATNHC